MILDQKLVFVWIRVWKKKSYNQKKKRLFHIVSGKVNQTWQVGSEFMQSSRSFNWRTVAVNERVADKRSRIKNEFNKHGRGKPRSTKRRWYKTRDIQSHIKKNPSHTFVKANRSFGKLRSNTERVFFRSTSRCFCTSTQLLSYWKITLSNRCMWTVIRGRIRFLGTRFQSSGTLLLDDLHSG